MRQMMFSDAVKFVPWIDVHGYSQSDVKVLFVGESHYASPAHATDRELTIDVVHQARVGQLNRQSGKGFFTNIAALAKGRLLSPEDREAWWPTVAFYNYIQVPVGQGPRVQFNLELFNDAHQAFHNVIETIRPELVVVLGRRVWFNMSTKTVGSHQNLKCSEVDAVYREAWRYSVGGGETALSFHVRHPSSGFNFRTFNPLFRSALAEVAKGPKERG